MRRLRLLVLVLAASLLAGGAVSAAAREAGAVPSVEAKKKCKIVKKRVHGKIKRVRVCTKPKPAPSLPSKVSVTLDSAHVATASISADSGGTLSAGGATLTMPAGAVAETTSVTMTPVTKLGGLTGQLLGAVQFQPDGLELLKPVTLTIDVPSTSDLQAFSYAGNGSDFHLYPLKVEAGTAILKLFHFSGYGVGQHLPSSVDALRKQLNNSVKPAVTKATHDRQAFFNAVLVYTGWKNAVNSRSDTRRAFATDIADLEEKLAVALERIADQEHEDCVTTHDIVRTGKKINDAIGLVTEVVGHGFSGPIYDAVEYAIGQQIKCERFELDFDSEITGTPGGFVGDVRVEGVKLNSDNHWTNQAPLDYWSFQLSPPSGCSMEATFQTVKPFTAKLGDPGDWYNGASPPSISMQVFVGEPSEHVTWVCPVNSVPSVEYLWWNGMIARHGLTPFTIGDWKYVGQSLFAERTYTGSSVGGGGIWSERTTFKLRHTPE